MDDIATKPKALSTTVTITQKVSETTKQQTADDGTMKKKQKKLKNNTEIKTKNAKGKRSKVIKKKGAEKMEKKQNTINPPTAPSKKTSHKNEVPDEANDEPGVDIDDQVKGSQTSRFRASNTAAPMISNEPVIDKDDQVKQQLASMRHESDASNPSETNKDEQLKTGTSKRKKMKHRSDEKKRRGRNRKKTHSSDSSEDKMSKRRHKRKERIIQRGNCSPYANNASNENNDTDVHADVMPGAYHEDPASSYYDSSSDDDWNDDIGDSPTEGISNRSDFVQEDPLSAELVVQPKRFASGQRIKENTDIESGQIKSTPSNDSSIKKNNTTDRSRKNKFTIVVIVCCVIVLLIVVASVVRVLLSRRNQTETPNPDSTDTNNIFTNDAVNDPQYIVTRDGIEMTYIFKKTEKTWNKHNEGAERCGGDMASITNEEEYNITISLIQSTLGSLTDVWIGGVLIDFNTTAHQTDEFGWSDSSQPFYSKWVDGQPNHLAWENGLADFKHCVFLNEDGLMEHTSQLNKLSAIFLLPLNHDDITIYPNCKLQEQ